MSRVPAPAEGAAAAADTPYAHLGGESALRALVERFYDLMDLEPAYAGIRALHAPALDDAREKLFMFLALSLLILVGSINIFFSLMMLAIDKRKDISVLVALGASPKTVRRIFLAEGALMSFTGAAVGLALGGLLCWLQDQFGLVGMGMESAIVSSYPVKMKLSDLLLTGGMLVISTVLIALYPAQKAAKTYSVEHL